MRAKTHTSTHGFTLVELSLVIVIIGLIIGGVILGSSMLQASALQSVVADFDKYRNAAIAYRDKYGELPGDHSTASNNVGNGDGFIGDALTTNCTISNYEPIRAWQHLSDAGLVPVTYSGTTTAISPNVNVPISKVKNASFMLSHYKSDTGCASFSANAGHVMYVGKPTTTTTPFVGAVFTPEDAKSIDLKMDDGKPALGKVMTPNATTQTGCATLDTADAVYGTSSTPTCSLILFTGF